MPGVEVVATYDTAGSARLIREGGLRDTAAIASARAAEIFGLDILKAGIQDFEDNITRFIVISRDPQPLGPPDKTTLAFALHNAPGALFKALSVFALRDIDLTKLESRPARGLPWEYLFYADVGVGRDDVRCSARDRAPLGVCALGQDARLLPHDGAPSRRPVNPVRDRAD